MSAESVRVWLAEHASDLPVITVAESTATVATAAAALGVEPGRIAKTLAVRAGEQLFLLVARGDARLDNRKCKDEFGARPRMLGPEETLELTGHPVGGVCPFGLKTPIPVYLDELWGSIFSFRGGKLFAKSPELSPRRVSIWFGEPLHEPGQAHGIGRHRPALLLRSRDHRRHHQPRRHRFGDRRQPGHRRLARSAPPTGPR